MNVLNVILKIILLVSYFLPIFIIYVSCIFSVAQDKRPIRDQIPKIPNEWLGLFLLIFVPFIPFVNIIFMVLIIGAIYDD